MNKPYVIIADMSADMSPTYALEQDIRFIPMNYTIDDEDFVCQRMGDPALTTQFYESQRQGKNTHTAQVSPQQCIDTFTPLLKAGESILYLTLSSGLSNTYQSAIMATEELKEQFPDAKIRCVDSLGATAGMGLLLESAAKNRAAGMTLDENADWLEANRLRVCHWFMVEDLLYLKRGGRISAATAVVGTALNIKPILKIEDDGRLLNFAKKRGVKAATKYLVELYQENADGGEGESVYIVHAGCPENAAYLEQAVKELNPSCVTTIVPLSPIIGAHTGPGMCALVFYGKR